MKLEGVIRRELLLLSVIGASFATFAWVFVPRLTNAHFGDVEFTGWTGPVAERVARGARPYVDFVLPIPPGSFAVLALIQRVTGRALLLQELWLEAALHFGMGLLAYATAARFTTRLNAVLVAVCSLITVINMPKECAYDHTAQFVAWSSVAAGAAALFEAGRAARRRWWFVTGLLAAATLTFKQSTGVGILAGWGIAQLYLAGVERWSGQRVSSGLGDSGHFLGGAALGVALGAGLLLGLGGSLGGYVQSVLIEGPALKGGSQKIARDLLKYVTLWPTFPPTLFVGIGLVLTGRRILAQRGSFHLGDELGRRDAPIARKEALLVAGSTTAAFVGAAICLSLPWAFPEALARELDRLKYLPHFGLAAAAAFMIAHFRRVEKARPGALTIDPDRAGHALNALLLAALFCSFLHNTSAPEFRPFYDNNPIVPLAYAMLFIALDRARAPRLKALAVLLTLGSLFSSKLARASEAYLPAASGTHWQGMRLSDRGRTMESAAERVRALTKPSDTVLVLPEDVTLAARIGRPRPALRGAILFVDQYPRRLADADIETLDRSPPTVVVLNPTEDQYWVQMYRIWNGDSGAERVTRHILTVLLPQRYKRDQTFPTRWYGRDARLEIWVRR